jgi:predicted solute-binding protein
LAQVIWRELYGTAITIGIGDSGTTDPDSILLIGDKVINQAPRGYGFEVDLGAAWKHLFGLPFVFAAWFARKEAGLPGIEQLLAKAVTGASHMVEQIAIDRRGTWLAKVSPSNISAAH